MPPVDLLMVLAERVVVADGAMGMMLQSADLRLDDFEGHGAWIYVARPDIVRGVHDTYFASGCDVVEINTFGANRANSGEYDIGLPARIGSAVAVRRGWEAFG